MSPRPQHSLGQIFSGSGNNCLDFDTFSCTLLTSSWSECCHSNNIVHLECCTRKPKPQTSELQQLYKACFSFRTSRFWIKLSTKNIMLLQEKRQIQDATLTADKLVIQFLTWMFEILCMLAQRRSIIRLIRNNLGCPLLRSGFGLKWRHQILYISKGDGSLLVSSK